jgi:hypothetical protein
MPPRLEKLIAENVPKCINSHCDNKGSLTVAGHDGEAEQEQCEYCYRERFPLQNLTLAAWNAALEAVREGVPPTSAPDADHTGEYNHHKYDAGFNTCRTAVTDHINSLGV